MFQHVVTDSAWRINRGCTRMLEYRGRPKWILLADPMADVSVTTSADVQSDPMFLDITVICMQRGPFVSD